VSRRRRRRVESEVVRRQLVQFVTGLGLLGLGGRTPWLALFVRQTRPHSAYPSTPTDTPPAASESGSPDVAEPELVGPETPHTTHDYGGIDSRTVPVFGIRNRPLPVDERREHCRTCDVPQPQLFGRYDPEAAVADVREVVASPDAAGREGGERVVEFAKSPSQ